MPERKAPRPTAEGRARAVIDAVLPSVDGGRFAVKCVAGEPLAIVAHCFADGHDVLRVMLRWCAERDKAPHEVEMVPEGNDVWRASFTPPLPGRYRYHVAAWVDGWRSWRHDLERRVDADDIRIALLAGAALLDAASARAKGEDRKALKAAAKRLPAAAGDAGLDAEARKHVALDEALAELCDRYPDRRFETVSTPELPLTADRERARYSTWYEMFPRSASEHAGRHGTLRDVEARLPHVAEMGFDVLYLPPIHPIGREKRKGRNNALEAEPGDVGSPWAIGAEEGGHKAIHPQLGDESDFARLVQRAAAHGIEVALDVAFQCAPDHPYVKAHPGWFRTRPDGSVQYAENPPKKYQDIYPFDFESDDWQALWIELKGVFEHWIERGVRIFRVDNPHTKAFAFWEWAIGEIRRAHPDVLFLSEAFTRPKVMHRLAKLGFSQSYTYFTWRNGKRELTDYFTELAHGPGRDYFRPNVWPNTPDILGLQLHGGGRPIFAARLVLAATLAASYGIYGPAYELMENTPRSAGSEEYLHSEKYELRRWDLSRADSLAPLIARVNRIRRDNPALHADRSLVFLDIDNDQLIAYCKQSGDNVIVTVVNLDSAHRQSGWLDLGAAGVEGSLQLHDLLSDQHFAWQSARGFILLDPAHAPAHVFRVIRRNERDFEYYE